MAQTSRDALGRMIKLCKDLCELDVHGTTFDRPLVTRDGAECSLEEVLDQIKHEGSDERFMAMGQFAFATPLGTGVRAAHRWWALGCRQVEERIFTFNAMQVTEDVVVECR